MYQARQKKHKARQMQPVQRKNKTGIPDHIKAGTEYLTGVDLSDVRVHYNSPKPAQLNAHAYAQGTNIYVAPGQKKHIEHETWHIGGQQALGRVPATTQFAGQPINDDPALEREADVMGRKAAQTGRKLIKNTQLRQKKADKTITAGHQVSQLGKKAKKISEKDIKATKDKHGISKKAIIKLKTHRPPYALGQELKVWRKQKRSDGTCICPNSGETISWDEKSGRQGVWDMGHKSGHEYRSLWQKLADGNIDYDTFLQEYQNPDNYQVEDPTANRSHQYEAG